ncbi:hypothetical protein ACU686_30395 [Yinghuangia aomiensis]
MTVTVDGAKAPSGHWTANVRIQPGSSQVTIEGASQAGSRTASPVGAVLVDRADHVGAATGPATTGKPWEGPGGAP